MQTAKQNERPHTGWLEMLKPFIAAYKAGVTSVRDYITEEKLVYWYRTTKKGIVCDVADTTLESDRGNFFRGRPHGWESMTDEIFIVALLKSPARVLVQSGDQLQVIQAPAGISAHSVPMGIGQQRFVITRGRQTVLSGTSLKDIVNTCACGIYNFNAYVGTLPTPSTIDRLQSAGLAMLSQGLKAPCPTNTLGMKAANSVLVAETSPAQKGKH